MPETKNVYEGRCKCGSVRLKFQGAPVAAGYCHCVECRAARESDALDFVAWKPEQQEITKGNDKISTYDHTDKMTVYFCSQCGAGLYHTNVLGVHATSCSLFRNANEGQLPQGLEPQLHIHYGERVIDVADSLPKFKDLPESFGGSGERLD